MRWPTVKVASIRAKRPHSLVGGPFGSELTTKDYVEEGIPVIRGSNLADDQPFRDEGFVFVTERKADLLRANNAFAGDLIFTQRGTLGQVGVIPLDSKYPRYLLSQSQMKLAVDEARAAARFVYYFFRCPETVQKVKNLALTSGVPHINLGILRDFDVPLPPLEAQKRIIDCLSAYDDLIANNQRRMKLLEEAARLLYQEWFVRLKFPGHEHSPIVDGVPQGWHRKPLGQQITLNYGKSLKADERVDGVIPVYGSSGIVGHHEKALVSGPGIIVGRKGNVGSVYWSSGPFFPIDTVYYVDPAQADFYLYYALRGMHFISTDVAVPGLNRDFAYSRPLLLPSASIVRQFNEFADPIHRQIDNLEAMNSKIRSARDLLLPRLMSGEIAV